jgi:hypothetical protein
MSSPAAREKRFLFGRGAAIRQAICGSRDTAPTAAISVGGLPNP